jgi:hypothetical protein
MDAEAGLTRLARVVEIVGMIWAGLWVGGGVLALFIGKVDEGVVVIACVLLAALGYGVTYAAGWIIRGFAQRKA